MNRTFHTEYQEDRTVLDVSKRGSIQILQMRIQYVK